MAAAHVSGVAAMVLASGVLPPKLKGTKLAGAVASRLERTPAASGCRGPSRGQG